jgi:peptide/nickel transport system permease protein
MFYYLLTRLLRAALTLILALSITFLILRLMPADPVAVIADSRMTETDIAVLTEEFGLDKPLYQQYTAYIFNLFRGKLGLSFATRQPVADLLKERLPWTILLNVSALTVSLLLGTVFGVIAACRPKSLLAGLLEFLAAFGTAIFIPSIGLLLLYLLGVKFPLLPIGGANSPGGSIFWPLDVARHLILPVSTLSIVIFPHYFFPMRASMHYILEQEYMRTARGKGMTTLRLIRRHGVRNALIPTVNMSGLLLGALMGGSVLTETVFSYPGIGRLIYEAVGRLDYPVLQGAFLTLSAAVIILSIVADLLYLFLDPRLRAYVKEGGL